MTWLIRTKCRYGYADRWIHYQKKGSGTGITGGISGTGLTCYIVNEGVEELLEAYVNALNSVRINQVLKWLPCLKIMAI